MIPKKGKAGAGARKSLAVIGLAHGVADSIEKSYHGNPPKTIKQMVDNVRARCQECFDAWPEQLSKKDIKRINDGMKVTDIVLERSAGSAAAFTSMALALLSDLYDELKDPKKSDCVLGLMGAMKRLHRNYDRKLNRWNDYDAANAAVKALNEKGV